MSSATVLQTYFVTPESRVAASAVAMAALVTVALAIRRGGHRFKREYPADDVEAVQAVGFSVAAAVTAWFLVVVWRAENAVASSLEVIRFGPRQGVLALVAVLTLIVAYTLTRVSKGLLDRRGGDVITAHRREVIHHVVQIGVYLTATAFVLSLAGVNPANLLVGAGAVGLVVGLAARQTLGSVLAGLVLIFSRPFEVRDWIVIGDQEGIVTDITLFNTQLRTYDDEHVIIPNDEVGKSEVVNRSRSGRLRCSVDVGIDYDADVGRAADVAERAMAECDAEPLLSQPSPVAVGKQFGDSAVVLECRFWISDPSAPRLWQTQTAVIRAIKDAYEREGIKIPFPQRELMGREETAGLRLSAPQATQAGGGATVTTPDGAGEYGGGPSEGRPESGSEERSSGGSGQ